MYYIYISNFWQLFVGANQSPPSEKVSPQDTVTNTSTGNNINASNTSSPALDFNAELTKHLTLKRQKHNGTGANSSVNATEANLKTNRGPPPQPPGLKMVQSPNEAASINKNGSPPFKPAPPQIPESNSSSLFKKQQNR